MGNTAKDITALIPEKPPEGARLHNGSHLTVETAAGYLASATDMHEIKDIRDKAQAVSYYLRTHEAAEGAIEAAAEIVLRAERRLGQLCKEVTGGKAGGGSRGSKDKSNSVSLLSDLDITKAQSSRWQRLARVSERAFQAYLDDCLNHGRIPTQAGALRLGRGPAAKARPFDYQRWIHRLQLVLDEGVKRCPKGHVEDFVCVLEDALERLKGK